jgi:energy-coupling factor transport system ATP-binding protein
MALAVVERLSFAYTDAGAALRDISLQLDAGERVALLGPSGSGKSTLLRALAGLVPHFHGGRFEGRVEIAGQDTRRAHPADLAGTVATVFQDPEDQVVMTLVANEIAFGLENVGVDPTAIWPRVERALELVGAAHLAGRRTVELSGGELQRVCLAATLALEPQLLLLDEPTSQLDGEGADGFLDALAESGCAVVLSEHRIERALRLADRVLYLEEGRLLLDAPAEEACAWLAAHRPLYSGRTANSDTLAAGETRHDAAPVVEVDRVSFAYGHQRVLDGVSLRVSAGEIVVLEGPNGSGKTTLAKLAAGLLEPELGAVRRNGRAAYLSQDPGRYLVRETVLNEVALGVHGDLARAEAALRQFGLGAAASRHPRDLSSGERERLGLAAVAVVEPDLLVLDEPTRGVDPGRKAEIGAWLAERARAGQAILVATHDRTLPAHRRVRLAAEVTVAV